MKKLFLLFSFSVVCSIAGFSQYTIKAGLGQDVSGWGVAYEAKVNKIAASIGAGLYTPSANQFGWEISFIYYPLEKQDSFNSSPYLLIGYGTYGAEWAGQDEIEQVYYGVYGLAGYKWWINKFSIQLGAGIANNRTVESSGLDFSISGTIGIQIFD